MIRKSGSRFSERSYASQKGLRALPASACHSLPRSAETGRCAGRAVAQSRPGAVCETARRRRIPLRNQDRIRNAPLDERDSYLCNLKRDVCQDASLNVRLTGEGAPKLTHCDRMIMQYVHVMFLGSPMASSTNIEWTDATWNPVIGCTKISAGCDHCYAERFSERFRGTPGHPFETGFDLTLRSERLEQPLSWRVPRMIFVNSMSDLFHKRIPQEFIARVFDTMEAASWHTFQVLTKRSSLMRDFLRRRYQAERGPRHIWLGVSVEDGTRTSRIRHLRQAPAGVRFLSIEPLIGPVRELDLTEIDWVIVGGESGPGARPMKEEWALDIRDQCVKAGVPFFFKQWGGRTPKTGGRLLGGEEWSQFPHRKESRHSLSSERHCEYAR